MNKICLYVFGRLHSAISRACLFVKDNMQTLPKIFLMVINVITATIALKVYGIYPALGWLISVLWLIMYTIQERYVVYWRRLASCSSDALVPAAADGKSRIMISDLRLFAMGDQWGAVVELMDGSEVPIWAVNGNDKGDMPPWAKSVKAYESWYNRSLEEAHRQGYYLEGETPPEQE